MNMKPSLDFYSYLQSAFDFFNSRLFDDKLSPVMFTITRKKSTAGYFRANGWIVEGGDNIHEIAINPQYFITSSPLELYQTIVHELVHQFQYEHGTPSRTNYHNTEWAEKMKSIGLMPISKNGKGTGQSVSDKPIAGGIFERACSDFFMAGYKLAIVDSQYNSEKTLKLLNDTLEGRINGSISSTNEYNEALTAIGSEDGAEMSLSQPITDFYNIDTPTPPKPTYSKKTAYKCPNCGYTVWGAFGLPIGCLDCHVALSVVTS